MSILRKKMILSELESKRMAVDKKLCLRNVRNDSPHAWVVCMINVCVQNKKKFASLRMTCFIEANLRSPANLELPAWKAVQPDTRKEKKT